MASFLSQLTVIPLIMLATFTPLSTASDLVVEHVSTTRSHVRGDLMAAGGSRPEQVRSGHRDLDDERLAVYRRSVELQRALAAFSVDLPEINSPGGGGGNDGNLTSTCTVIEHISLDTNSVVRSASRPTSETVLYLRVVLIEFRIAAKGRRRTSHAERDLVVSIFSCSGLRKRGEIPHLITK